MALNADNYISADPSVFCRYVCYYHQQLRTKPQEGNHKQQ